MAHTICLTLVSTSWNKHLAYTKQTSKGLAMLYTYYLFLIKAGILEIEKLYRKLVVTSGAAIEFY